MKFCRPQTANPVSAIRFGQASAMGLPRGLLLVPLCVGLFLAPAALAQENSPSDQDEPFLQVKAGGPQSYITALAFSPDGDALYAGGWDKVVHIWRRDEQSQQFTFRPDSTFRIPVGPGLRGAINAMALSSDGNWLAVAGHGIMRGGGTFRRPGRVLPSEGILTPEMRLDEGVIHVFNTRTREVHPIRGHAGAVVALAFAPGNATTPVLVSAAREWVETANAPAQYRGTVRAWDVLRAEHANQYIGGKFLPEPLSRPGIAARRTGPRLSEIEVGIAWGDAAFRVWNAARDELRTSPVGRYSNTVVAANENWLTGGFDRTGVLQARSPLEVGQTTPLLGREGDFLIPRALAVPSGVGNSTHSAVVSRVVRQDSGAEPGDFVIHLNEILDGVPNPSRGPSRLWKVPNTGAIPALAISNSHRLVAVAGDSDQSIWLYTWDAIAAQDRPFQTLRNLGSSWKEVAFVRKNDRRGLRLRGASGDLIFDLEQQVGVGNSTGWNDAPAEPNGFRVDVRQADGKTSLVIFRGGQESNRIQLADQEVHSTHAIVSTPELGRIGRRTIMAVATHQLGQPTLRLYDLETGTLFRQLTGHTQTIDDVSFSTDGALLASIAGDQTLRLWDISDIGSILLQHGMLNGVSVRRDAAEGARGAVVTHVKPDFASALSNLRQGESLLDLSLGGQTVTWSGGREFFDAFWSLPPGATGQLNVRGPEGQRQIDLKIGQAVDERKPLLTLFVATPRDGQPPEWIAWTPIGPYEASGRTAERFLGWHFNTGDPASPVRFAAADQYREMYYRDGLIKQLVGKGVVEQAPPPAPAMSIRFGPEAMPSRGADGGLVVRERPQSVHVFVSDFPTALVESVAVTALGESYTNSNRLHDDEWTIELFGLQWSRGAERFRTIVRTNETPSREFVSETTVAKIPLPPQIESELPETQTVEEESFRFTAQIQAIGSDDVATRLVLNGVTAADQITELRVDRELTLQPGHNQIEIVSTNSGAGSDTQALETARRIFQVIYQKAPTLPPEIMVERIETVDASGSSDLIALPVGGSRAFVKQPTIRVEGRIRSEEPVTQSTYWTTLESDRTTLELQSRDEQDSWSFQVTARLRPGLQELLIRAASAESDAATVRIPVEFAPGLPKIVLAAGQRGVIETDAGQPPAEVVFAGEFEGVDPSYPFEARVLVNDEAIGTADVDLADARWSAKFALRGGENQIRLVLSNEWGRTTTSETRFIEYRRLPRIVDAQFSEVGREPFTDISVRIECPLDRPLSDVSVNGRHLDAASWKKIEELENSAIWEATAQQVPLRPGENRLRVVASNLDGTCREPSVLVANYDAAFWKPARITFLNAAPSSSVVDPDYELEFRVESPSPLRDIRVDLNRRPVAAADITREDHDDRSVFRVRLALDQGVNRIVARVQNAGGEIEGQRQISFVPPPVRVTVDSLTPLVDSASEIRPTLGIDQQLRFEQPLTSGYARLKGVVEWNRVEQGEAAELRFWVNGFQQRPIKIDPSQPKQPFETVVVLGERKNNRIVLDLVGAASDSQSRLSFSVDCTNPRGGQRLHLLTIGIDKQDPALLQDRALHAVGAEIDKDEQFRKPYRAAGFDRINIYPPLNGKVTFSDVFRLLLDVRSDLLVPTGLDPSGEPIPVNDVVMVYYEGGLLLPQKDHFVLSTSEAYDPKVRFSAISSEWLAKFFDSMRGAQLAFIDVAAKERQSTVPVADWSHDSHAALLCYAWSDGSAPPAEMRLINAVRKALASVDRLGELDRILASLSSGAEGLNYHRALPDHLRTIVLRRH